MKSVVAIVGVACIYGDINNPDQLWYNVLNQRRSFRQIPSQRLSENYFSKTDNDKIYTKMVSVIKNYIFDRFKYRISGSTYRSADLTHWLTLDVATKALEDSKLLQRGLLPKKETGVYIGNTMNGEFTRSNIMRIRWPFVERKLSQKLQKDGWSDYKISTFLDEFEKDYKLSFPSWSEDSLAGGLSNTIAGRICNYYDLNGGAYTIDGACSSSLLAVINGCQNIENGNNIVNIVGGVDLSLDPFELVGFSRTEALAKSEMLIYDKNSNGFWPGEGCGIIILANLNFAIAHNLKIYATINGYGISTDGQGGLTRPNVKGQELAIKRTYDKAKYPITEVDYFEGHGTGTAVGDQVELETIIKCLSKTNKIDRSKKYYIGSVKGNIGHTKAAAGIAGLIKALKVINNRIIPPITGCKNIHPILKNTILNVPFEPIAYNKEQPMKASISAMGFGGINTHITIEDGMFKKNEVSQIVVKTQINSDCEIFFFEENTIKILMNKLIQVASFSEYLSIAEMADLSLNLYHKLGVGSYRAVIVAKNPIDLKKKIDKLISQIKNGKNIFFSNGIYLSNSNSNSTIGFLFPGQGSKTIKPDNYLLRKYKKFTIPMEIYKGYEELSDLESLQSSVIGTSLFGIKLLEEYGIDAQYGIGHSLGEISCLAWSESLNFIEAYDLAKVRGNIMDNTEGIDGLMLIISDTKKSVQKQIKEFDVQIAALNSNYQTVVSGNKKEIEKLKIKLDKNKIPSVFLPVKTAFHSKLMKAVENKFKSVIESLNLASPKKIMVSTVTGNIVNEIQELKQNLLSQLSEKVNFLDALIKVDEHVGLWVEVGGDSTLQSIVKNISKKPIISLELSSGSLEGLFQTIAFSWVNKIKINSDKLFQNKSYKEMTLDWSANFFSNPCETDIFEINNHLSEDDSLKFSYQEDLSIELRKAIAKKLELPFESILEEHKMLDDLHLNSLEVGQIINNFALINNIKLASIATEYSNASIKEIIETLSLSKNNKTINFEEFTGVETWTHCFKIIYKKQPLLQKKRKKINGNTKASKWILLGNELYLGKRKIDTNDLINEGIILNLVLCNETEILNILDLFIQKLKQLRGSCHIIVFEGEKSIAAFMKSIAYEMNELKILYIKKNSDLNIEQLKDEIENNNKFSHVWYREGKRYTPIMVPVFDNDPLSNLNWNNDDVILVTGGGKGITVECAIAFAQKYKVKLALIGRTNVNKSKPLAENLKRFEKLGIVVQYFQADLTDVISSKSVINSIELTMGKITGFIHGAGINIPKPWHEMNYLDFSKTLGPKLFGLRNILDQLNTNNLKMLLTFGSIIGENGMRGNADYALSNEWLREEVLFFSNKNPACKCLNAEWSVWSGAGMGEHLGVIDNFIKSGIHPIPLKKGVEFFMKWMANFPLLKNIIISGRYGKTYDFSHTHYLPNLRFIDDIIIHYPGIELICEFELSQYNDLYLEDHEIFEDYIFPGVMGLEAIHQAVSFLCPSENFTFGNTLFEHPIILKKGETIKVRILALRISYCQIKVVIRCSSTDFQKNHFSSTINLIDKKMKTIDEETWLNTFDEEKIEIDVSKDVYNNLLFHKGIYQVINKYTHLTPYSCVFESEKAHRTSYFNYFMSDQILGLDPMIRDSILHGIQVCDPLFSILPIGFKSVKSYYSKQKHNNNLKFTIIGNEISKIDNIYTFSYRVYDLSGNLIEIWEEVKFKVLSNTKNIFLTKKLLEVAIERKVKEVTGIPIKFHKYGYNQNIMKRNDGKPLLIDKYVSRTNIEKLALEVTCEKEIGCDVEKITEMTPLEWKNLISNEKFKLANYISKELKEDINISSTRVWGIIETLKKSDLSLFENIEFNQKVTDNMLIFKIGSESKLISFVFSSAEVKKNVALTICIVNPSTQKDIL